MSFHCCSVAKRDLQMKRGTHINHTSGASKSSPGQTKKCFIELNGGFILVFTKPANNYPSKSSADSRGFLLARLLEPSELIIGYVICIEIINIIMIQKVNLLKVLSSVIN